MHPYEKIRIQYRVINHLFINNEHFDNARSYLMAKTRLIARSEGMSDLVVSPASSTTGSLVNTRL